MADTIVGKESVIAWVGGGRLITLSKHPVIFNPPSIGRRFNFDNWSASYRWASLLRRD